MAILTASNVSQSFGSFDVFSGVSVGIPRDGKIGLVGPNGIGKTTLLLILAGRQAPSTGSVHLARGARLGYLSQESADEFVGQAHSVYDEMLAVFADLRRMEAQLRELEARMAADGEHLDHLLDTYSELQQRYELAGGYEYETRIRMTLTGLGFAPDTWQLSLAHLSGGQKTRVLLGRLLLQAPDLLILDEPTNHLDIEAVEWLENTLGNWPGAALIVSHDRYFLDRAVNTIWEMNRDGIETYRGDYTAYVQQRQERWEKRQREYETFQEHLAKEMDFIRRNISGQRTQMAQGKLSRLAREVAAVRIGGLGILSQLNTKSWAQLAAELDIRGVAETVGELQAQIAELPAPTRPPLLNVRLRSAHRSGNIVLRANDVVIGYPERPLFAVDELELHRQECAALIGPNGAGKTTFLRTILGQLPPLAGEVELGASLKIAYFAQTQEALRPDNTVLDELLRHQEMTISEARNYLARFLFRGDDVYSRVSTLSGGEKARLALALLVLQEANFLLLDEPTNHLDIPSQEILQSALEAFDGTALLVTHDRYLVDHLATQIWDLERPRRGQGRLRVFGGSYQEYLAARAAGTGQPDPAPTAAPAEPSGNGSRQSKNEARRRAEAIRALEAAVAGTEQTVADLQQAMQTAAEKQSYTELQELTRQYEAAEERLQLLLQQWEELAHEPDYHRTDG